MALAIVAFVPHTVASVVAPTPTAAAESFTLPPAVESVVGWPSYTRVRGGETLLEIARRFDLGHDQIIAANPLLNRWLPPPRARVLLPTQYILPPTERKGLVLNLAELRLYFYPPSGDAIHTYPVSIGDQDWRTPLGRTTVVGLDRDPAWTPPPSIRAEHLAEGEELPTFIPGGTPENPLGHFALRLARRGYLIHGTDERRAMGIGMRVSHGCIRLYPEDIEELFYSVHVGTPVLIIDQPVKVGWRAGRLWLQVHYPPDSDEQVREERPDLAATYQALRAELTRIALATQSALPRLRLDIAAITATVRDADGVATPIGEVAAAPDSGRR